MYVLITGGTGVIARNLASNLSAKEYEVLLATRETVSISPVPTFKTGNIDGETNWKEALYKIDI
jgi:nucleoside-diphosphate-sugar epimerase